MAPARLLHLSDLHFGTREAPDVAKSLAPLIERVDPELVVASGDLTHRGRPDQHDRAAAFLRSLGRPLLAIPGNHDIPYTLPGALHADVRRSSSGSGGRRSRLYASESLAVVGLNSVRAWRHQSGGLPERQLLRAGEQLARAPEGALRVVVLHHHLIGAPWRSRKKPVARRSEVLARLVDAGAELILAGHIHQGAVSERHEFEVVAGDVRGAVVSIAPGLGQPRPQRRGEARGLHAYFAGDGRLRVETYIWRDDDWALTAVRRFPRGRGPLAVEPL